MDAIPYFLFIVVMIVSMAVVFHVYERNKAAEEAERRNRAREAKEWERKRRAEERDREKARRERRRQLDAESRERHAVEKRLQKIYDSVENSSTLRNLAKAIDEAPQQLSAIDKTKLSGYYTAKHSALSALTDQQTASLYNAKLRAELDRICNAAVMDMKSVEEFYHDLRRLFHQTDDIDAKLPEDTKALIRELRQEVGYDECA